MHTLITGAGGFVGSTLLTRLLASATREDRFTALDVGFSSHPVDPRVRRVVGKLSDAATLADALSDPADLIFHLATVAGVKSASEFELGLETNLIAGIRLLEALRKQGNLPRLVYSSSVGTIGELALDHVDDLTLPLPTNSYGAHKFAMEILINDYSRQGFVDGLAIRLPGIVARPAGSTTMLSAFLSDVFHAARNRQAFEMPLAPDTRTWMMSVQCCVDNLVHAASVKREALPMRRNWALPVLLVGIEELVAALSRRFGDEVLTLVSYQPVAWAEAMFGHVPLESAGAERMGFRNDGDVDQLVTNVIAGSAQLRQARR
jgi:nucleoside-diphosphate-sugar epimerase